MRFRLAIFLPLILWPATWDRREATLTLERIAGGGSRSSSRAVITWGDTLREWNPRTLRSRMVARGPFGEGGCVTDIDGDGREEVVSVQGRGLGSLMLLQLQGDNPETIDTEVEMHDCMQATLFGRTGVLMIHRGTQVRFYQRVAPGRWEGRDIYSIYTPSYQTGLAMADVDGDGLPDIFCGNYWIRSPRMFEESWRLYAINLWFEEPDSASLRIAVLSPGRIVAAQAHAAPARFARFDAQADPREQWTAFPLAPNLRLDRIHGLAVWRARVVAGSAKHLISVDPNNGKAEIIGSGFETLSVVPIDARTFVTVQPDGISRWTQRAPRR